MMTDKQKSAVIAYARAGMSVNRAARDSFYHPNTIHSHLRAVKENTGLDPKNFFDLHRLYIMAKGEDG